MQEIARISFQEFIFAEQEVSNQYNSVNLGCLDSLHSTNLFEKTSTLDSIVTIESSQLLSPLMNFQGLLNASTTSFTWGWLRTSSLRIYDVCPDTHYKYTEKLLRFVKGKDLPTPRLSINH